MSQGADTPVQQFNPKHRIVGAIVLVAIAVVFLPMVLDSGRSRNSAVDPAIEVPEQDQKVFVSRIQPLEPGAAAPDSSAAAADQPTPPPSTKPSPSKVAPVKPAPTAPSASRPKTAAAVKEGWAVRIGTFASDANVERLMSALRGAGFKPNSDQISVSGEEATRIWVGPYADKAAAEKALAGIKKSTGAEGLIVAYPW